MPDGSKILVREIKKAMDGEAFKYIPDGERKQEAVPGMSKEEWIYYFQIYRFYTKFGMPHGKGWAEEQPWLIDFLAFMDDMRIAVESWRMSRTARTSGDNKDFMV